MTREERQRNLERKRVRMEDEKAMGGKERKGVGKRDVIEGWRRISFCRVRKRKQTQVGIYDQDRNVRAVFYDEMDALTERASMAGRDTRSRGGCGISD